MDPKKSGGKASYAATSSSSPKNWVGHSPEGFGFGNIPKVDQLILDVAELSIDTTPQDNNGWVVISKKNKKNQNETSSPKQRGTRINEELCETVCDRKIVWPPMVMVRYHEKEVDKDDNKKYRTFADYDAVLDRNPSGRYGVFHHFSGYNPVHCFGHRGISVLIFENSVVGYVEAKRLHKHFADQGTDRDAWDQCKLLDGTRHQFYGYMANKEDIDFFNQHCRGEMRKVKFEMRSHHEMVVIPLDGVDERLFWLYSRAVKGEKDAKVCQDYYAKSAEKLRETMEENRIVRQRTKLQHEQNKTEDNGWAVFSKKNKNQGETSFPKQWGTRINEELGETVLDSEIVWPPMVMVKYHEKDDNEKVDKDDNEKWIRRENLKLPDYDAISKARHSVGPHGLLHYFSEYNAVEARHSFGHRGTSLLIFENSAIGYLEAYSLHRHLTAQRTHKDTWNHCKLLDGTRHPFYGYIAIKEDVDIFNQHCRDEMKVKFEMRSHHEMVVVPMDGVDQRLFWLYNMAVKREKDANARQDYYCKEAEKLRETMEENRIERQRTKLQPEQNKAEFFKDQINHIHQASEEERAFEELLPEERKKMQQSIVDTSANEDLRQEEISKVIQTPQAKNIKEFEAERKSHPNPGR